MIINVYRSGWTICTIQHGHHFFILAYISKQWKPKVLRQSTQVSNSNTTILSSHIKVHHIQHCLNSV